MALSDNKANIASILDARRAVQRDDSATVQSNLDFYDGDHWQTGDGWSGPAPASTEATYTDVMTEIERGFVSKNAIKEVVDRHANAIIGKEPVWTLVPNREVSESEPVTEEEQRAIDEAVALIRPWLDDRAWLDILNRAIRNALLTGSATLRLLIPPGLITDGEDGTVVSIDPNDPLNVLYLEAPHPLLATVVTDPMTMQRTGVYVGEVNRGLSLISNDGLRRYTQNQHAEISYVLPDGRTEITVLAGSRSRATQASVQLNLRGNLPIFEITLPRLISEQVRSQQRLLNLALTMMQRNTVLGGFLERIILNGQLPGHYETDPETQQQSFVRDDFVVGAGTTNAINGVPVFNDQGEVSGYTSASVMYRDPVSTQTFTHTFDSAYQAMLQEVDQSHALIGGDATTSGESRRQALAGFMASLSVTKQAVEQLGRQLIETALAYAAEFSGNPERFKNLKANFSARLNTGIIPAAELELVEAQLRMGVISLRTAREKSGVEDPEAEAQQIALEAEERDMINETGFQNARNVRSDAGTSTRTVANSSNISDNANQVEPPATAE